MKNKINKQKQRKSMETNLSAEIVHGEKSNNIN